MFSISVSAWGQILDLDMECPIIYPHEYIVRNEIHSISFVQSGDNIKKEVKKHVNAQITYFFDSAGVPCMKVINDRGDFIDTFMMNGMRCEYKSEPDSRFYEANVYCNEKGMVLANQTEKSNIFYKYDSLDRLGEWIQIDREQDEASNVFLIRYIYDSIGRMDSIIEKEGVLRYNLGIRQMDTIYKSSLIKLIH
jgi:hypothetical protein